MATAAESAAAEINELWRSRIDHEIADLHNQPTDGEVASIIESHFNRHKEEDSHV